MKAPERKKLVINPEFQAVLDALPQGPVKQPKVSNDIRSAGVGEPVEVHDRRDGSVSQHLAVALNKNIIVLDNNLRFSRKAGRWANGKHETHLFAKLVNEFSYRQPVADTTHKKLSMKAERPQRLPRVERSAEERRRMSTHLRNRIHYWFDAIFVKAVLVRQHSGKGKMRVNWKAIQFTYEIVRGPFDGFHRQFYIPLIDDMSIAHAFLEKAFAAEGLELEEDDKIDIKFIMDNLGERPVRLHNPASSHRLLTPDDIKYMEDDWILHNLGWELDEDGGAWESDEPPATLRPEY